MHRTLPSTSITGTCRSHLLFVLHRSSRLYARRRAAPTYTIAPTRTHSPDPILMGVSRHRNFHCMSADRYGRYPSQLPMDIILTSLLTSSIHTLADEQVPTTRRRVFRYVLAATVRTNIPTPVSRRCVSPFAGVKQVDGNARLSAKSQRKSEPHTYKALQMKSCA